MVEIYLKNVRCYSFHGCLKEESIIGSEYLVNLWVSGLLENSPVSDKIEDAIDYVFLNKIIIMYVEKHNKIFFPKFFLCVFI